MSDVRAPFNRPTVLTLARADALRRIIPADAVRDLERIAAGATAAGQRIQQAEIAHRESLDRRNHAAWQRGFSTGHAQALTRLRGFLAEVEARKRAVDAELVGLVAEAVGRIVRALPAELVTRGVIESALAEALGTHGRLVLRVHPARTAIAESWLRERGAAADLRVSVEADAALAEDDCALDTPAGTIDAGLRTQLEALGAAMRGAAAP
jgi:flagellar biosynthesis/type III secretory pathway protein FliH